MTAGYSRDAERGVIGAVLISERNVDRILELRIDAGHFHRVHFDRPCWRHRKRPCEDVDVTRCRPCPPDFISLVRQRST